MSQVSSIGSSEAVDTRGRRIGKRGKRKGPVMREIKGVTRHTPALRLAHVADYSHSKPGELFETFWTFAVNPLAQIAAMLVSTLGAEKAKPLTTGDLSALVDTAGGLQKAHGRNIKPEFVAQDLGMTVPDGFTPTFDIYLQVAKIRPDNNDTRGAAREVTSGVRAKLRKLLKGETIAPVENAAAPPGRKAA